MGGPDARPRSILCVVGSNVGSKTACTPSLPRPPGPWGKRIPGDWLVARGGSPRIENGSQNMYPELNTSLEGFQERLRSLRDAVGAEAAKGTLAELEAKMAAVGFWDNNERAQEVIAQVQRLKSEVGPVIDLSQRVDDLHELLALAKEEGDTAAADEEPR